MIKTEQHPAYANPAIAASIVRAMVGSPRKGPEGPQDPIKASAKIFELSKLPDPPLRIALGKDSNMLIKNSTTALAAGLEKYESWSENLQYDGDD